MRLALLIIVISVIASQSLSQEVNFTVGPLTCLNHNETTNTSLVIDCAGIKINSWNLTQELDLLLSDDVLRERLTSLEIHNTPLTEVPISVCRLPNLVALNLDRNRLSRLPDNCFTDMADLRKLSASYNNITALQDGLFDGLRNLEHIFLNWNQISTIGPEVFTEQSGLINLTLVSLSYNCLTTLEPWPAILGVRRSAHIPLVVRVRHNRIAALSNSIHWHYNCHMPPTYIYVDFSRNLLTRLTDMISGWGLDETRYLCLLRIREGHAMTRFSIRHNPFICDCRDFRFYSVEAHFVYADIFHGVYCSDPAELFGMSVVSVQLIQFTCDLHDGCPSGCECSYRPANATVHVACAFNNFSSLPFRLPALPKSYAKYKLDFSNNKLLRRLEHRAYFPDISFLDVSHCSLNEISSDAWRALVNIPVVFLNDNSIKELPREYSEVNITSRSISLNRNLWDCSCDRSWLHDWFNSDSTHFSDPGAIFCHSPPRLSGISIMRMNKEQFCVDPVQRAVTVSLLAVFGSVGLLIALCAAIYCLRVWVHRRWNFHPFDRDECVGEDMDYDVFFSCSSEDQDTHGRRLLDLMESKGYRVFRPGASATDETVAVVKRSRRTVCLLSKHFIKRFRFCVIPSCNMSMKIRTAYFVFHSKPVYLEFRKLVPIVYSLNWRFTR